MAYGPAYFQTTATLIPGLTAGTVSTTAICDEYREQVSTGGGGMGGGVYTSAQSDDYRFNAVTMGVPTATGHTPATPYTSTTNRLEDSWQVAIRGAVVGVSVAGASKYETT